MSRFGGATSARRGASPVSLKSRPLDRCVTSIARPWARNPFSSAAAFLTAMPRRLTHQTLYIAPAGAGHPSCNRHGAVSGIALVLGGGGDQVRFAVKDPSQGFEPRDHLSAADF